MATCCVVNFEEDDDLKFSEMSLPAGFRWLRAERSGSGSGAAPLRSRRRSRSHVLKNAGAGAKIQKMAEPPEPTAQKYDFWTAFFAKIPQKMVKWPERFGTFDFFVLFWKGKTSKK